MEACLFCQENFELRDHAPQLMPCLHLACNKCVRKLAQQSNQLLFCPSCGAEGEGFSIDQVVPYPSMPLTPLIDGPVCQDCDEQATHRCTNCSHLLCGFHEEAHRRSKTTKMHSVEPLATARALPKVSKNCSSHPDKDLSAFCDECQVVVCVECMVDAHRGHFFSSFAKAFATLQEDLQTQVDRLCECIPKLESTQQHLSTLHSALSSRIQSVTDNIHSAFNPLIHDLEAQVAKIQQRIYELEQRRDSLASSAQIQIKADIKTVETQQQALDIAKNRIIVTQHHTKALASQAQVSFLDALLVSNSVKVRIQQLRQNPPTSDILVQDNIQFDFVRPANLMTANLARLGVISQPSRTSERNFSAIAQPSLIFGTLGTADGQLQNPTGIAQLANKHIIIADRGNSRLQIFTPEGVFVRQFSISSSPRHITVAPTASEIWVAAVNSNALLCYSITGTMLRQISTKTPLGVAVCRNGMIIAACYTQNYIKAFNAEGVEQWTSTGDGFNYAFGVAVTQDGSEVVVCDHSNNRLQVLATSDGRFLRHIGAGQIEFPRAVAILHQDKVVVTEGSRVSIWTLTGELVHRWGSQPEQFSNAWGVTSLVDGSIAVVDNSTSKIQLF